MTELTMPKLSDSMEQGTILTWLKTDGEQVHAGEDLLEIETDKATVTHQVDVDGILEIIAPEGATLPVGAPIARVGTARVGPARAAAPVRSETNGGANADEVAIQPSTAAQDARRSDARHTTRAPRRTGSRRFARRRRRDRAARAGHAR